MKTRWLSKGEILEHVNPVMAAKGWAELNLESCRVLAAIDEVDGHIIEFMVIQLFPLLGPMLRIDEAKDSGATSRALAQQMYDYLLTENARGFLAIAESPFTKRICERFGMEPLDYPVYSFVPAKEAMPV